MKMKNNKQALRKLGERRFLRRLRTSLVVPALVALLVGCQASPTTAPKDEPEAVTVALRTLQDESRVDRLWVSGSTRAVRRVMPGSKLLGRIETVAVREGQRVVQGGLLARLESSDLEASVAQAEAAVTMATAQLENARAQHERFKSLHQRRSVTDKDLEDASAAFRIAEAAVAQAEANREAARVALGYATIKSPLAGWVVERRVEAGDMAAPGQALFVVEDLSRLEVELEVPDAEALELEVGESAEVEVAGELRQGAIDRIVPAGDPATRTFSVKLMLDNTDETLRSGMFVRAGLALGSRQLLAVPRSSVVSRGQLDGVFVAGPAERLELRWVRLGRALEGGEAIEVLSGLEAGERIVVDPAVGLEDGAPFDEGGAR